MVLPGGLMVIDFCGVKRSNEESKYVISEYSSSLGCA